MKARTKNVTAGGRCVQGSARLLRGAMVRPKGDPTNRRVGYRITEGEAAAEQELVRRHAKATGGSSQSGNAWFRWLLREEAKRQGLEIVEPPPPAATPTPASEKPRRSTSRSRPGRSS